AGRLAARASAFPAQLAVKDESDWDDRPGCAGRELRGTRHSCAVPALTLLFGAAELHLGCHAGTQAGRVRWARRIVAEPFRANAAIGRLCASVGHPPTNGAFEALPCLDARIRLRHDGRDEEDCGDQGEWKMLH